MEQKFSKQQIFEFYANRVDLGQRGSFTISGFAQAAQAYFNKDLKDLSPAEAALIAGIIQAPAIFALPPSRARPGTPQPGAGKHGGDARDLAGRCGKGQGHAVEAGAAQRGGQRRALLVDLLRETLISRLDERQMNEQGYRIYTTLDPDLQKAAASAVETGMKLVDRQVTKAAYQADEDR